MKYQTYTDRQDESLSARDGKESTKQQSFADRRHESDGARHHRSGSHGSSFESVFAAMKRTNASAGHSSHCNQPME